MLVFSLSARSAGRTPANHMTRELHHFTLDPFIPQLGKHMANQHGRIAVLARTSIERYHPQLQHSSSFSYAICQKVQSQMPSESPIRNTAAKPREEGDPFLQGLCSIVMQSMTGVSMLSGPLRGLPILLYSPVMPDVPMVWTIWLWFMTNTVIGTTIKITVTAAPTPALPMPPPTI